MDQPGGRAQSEQILVDTLREVGRWMSALELAAHLGWPWRIVARALCRLADRGDIESGTKEWIAARSRTRTTSIYRVRTQVMPAWLMPTLSVRIIGVTTIRRGVSFTPEDQ